MPNPFWNPQERRFRALWRLILQIIMLLLFQAIAGFFLIAVFPQESQTLSDPTQLLQNSLASIVLLLSAFLAVVLSVWLAGRWFDHRPFKEFGFHLSSRWWRDMLFGLVLGASLMAFIFLIELAAGWVTITGTFQSTNPGKSFAWVILYGLILFIAVGIQEELMSRGYILRNLAEGLNLSWISPQSALLLGYLFSAMVFGVEHAINPNATLISTLNIMIAGLLLGLGMILTGELAIPIGLHITWNFFEGYVFGFPVSGTTSAGNFIAIRQSGPVLWTGGAFGPEAGIIGLIAYVLGGVLIFTWVHWRRGKVALQTSLAEYSPTGDEASAGKEEFLPFSQDT